MDQFDLFYDEDWDDYEAAYGLRYNPQRIELSSEEADKLLRSALLRLGYRPGQNPLRGSDIEELARNLGYSRATAYKWPRGFFSDAAKITLELIGQPVSTINKLTVSRIAPRLRGSGWPVAPKDKGRCEVCGDLFLLTPLRHAGLLGKRGPPSRRCQRHKKPRRNPCFDF